MQNLWPLLLLLACPLMMIFMMQGMHGGGGRAEHPANPHEEHRGPYGNGDDERDRRIAELEREIVALRKDHPGDAGADVQAEPDRGRR